MAERLWHEWYAWRCVSSYWAIDCSGQVHPWRFAGVGRDQSMTAPLNDPVELGAIYLQALPSTELQGVART